MKFLFAYFTMVFTDWTSFFLYNLYALVLCGAVFCWLSLVKDKLSRKTRLLMTATSYFISHLITCLFLALHLYNGVSSKLCLTIYGCFLVLATGVYLLASFHVEKKLGGTDAV